jgi:hypothetical protein
MAFLDLAQPRLSPAVAGAASQAAFQGHEWAVIALARADGAASLSEPGRLRRLFESFFKIRRPNRLADPRLEALRRMAVLLRIGGGKTSDDERAGFLSAGYTRSQLSALAAYVVKAIRP